MAISILGTFTVVSEVRKVNSAPEYTGSPSQSAKVALEVVDPNAGLTTGKVAFEFTMPEGS